MRHALADVGGRHGDAAAAADCPAAGGRGARQVAVSATDTLPPAPTPTRARAPAPSRKGGGLHWFRLVVFALILIGVVATLIKSIWPSHGAPPLR